MLSAGQCLELGLFGAAIRDGGRIEVLAAEAVCFGWIERVLGRELGRYIDRCEVEAAEREARGALGELRGEILRLIEGKCFF